MMWLLKFFFFIAYVPTGKCTFPFNDFCHMVLARTVLQISHVLTSFDKRTSINSRITTIVFKVKIVRLRLRYDVKILNSYYWDAGFAALLSFSWRTRAESPNPLWILAVTWRLHQRQGSHHAANYLKNIRRWHLSFKYFYYRFGGLVNIGYTGYKSIIRRIHTEEKMFVILVLLFE